MPTLLAHGALIAFALLAARRAVANEWIGYLAFILIGMCAAELVRLEHNRRVKRHGPCNAPAVSNAELR